MTTSYSVAQWEANHASYDTGASYNIADTAADISAVLADPTYGSPFNSDSKIAQIVISDNLPVVIKVAQISGDATAISKLVNQNGSAAALTVNDTHTAIAASFATIGSDSQITSIVVSDNTAVTLTASQVANNLHALTELVNANSTTASVIAKDTAANITSSLAGLQSAGTTLTSIVVSNSAIMTLTAAQIASDATALGKVSNNNGGTVTFKVSDTGANIGSNLDALQSSSAASKITTITDSDNAAITLTVAQITSDAGTLSKVVNANTSAYTLNVADNAADIAAAASSLNGNSHVASVSVTDSTANAATQLDTLNGVNHLAIALSGATPTLTITEATFAAGLAALGAITNGSFAIDVTGVLVSQLSTVTSDFTGLSNSAHATLSVAINDTAANVQNQLVGLSAVSAVGTITLTDATPVLTLSEATFVGGLTALGKVTNGAFAIDVAGVLVSQLSTVTSDFTALPNHGQATLSIAVSDTAGNAAMGAQDLNDNSFVTSVAVTDTAQDLVSYMFTLGVVHHLSSVTLTDSGTPTVTTFATNFVDGLTALGLITNAAFDINVTGVLVSQLSTVIADFNGLGNAAHAALAITVADSAANITNGLATLNTDTQVTRIIVTDNGLTSVTIAQISSYSHALSELYQSDGTTPASLSVSDSASNISTAFDALQAAGNVTSIVINDGGTVTIGAASAANDTTALGELFIADGTTHAQVVVSDTAANVTSFLNGIETNIAHVGAIYATDGGSSNVVVGVAQLTSDAAALAELYSGSSGSTPQTLTVSDLAANLGGSEFDTLNSLTRVTKIVVSDSGSGGVVTIGAASAAADTTALGELTQADGTTSAQVHVSDTAANVTTYIDGLETSTGDIGKIIVSDSASSEVTITYAQLSSDSGALAKLYAANGSTPAHIAVTTDTTSIATEFATLNANTQVDKVILTDDTADSNEVILGVAQLSSDAATLAKLYESGGTTPAHIVVSDTASNIATGFASLNADTQVDKIIVASGGEVTLSAAAAVAGTRAEGVLTQADGTTPANVAIVDSAANVASNAAAINGDSHIDSVTVHDLAASLPAVLGALNGVKDLAITLTDGGTPTLSIPEGDLAFTTALDAISTAHSLVVTSALAADISTIQSEAAALDNSTLTGIYVSDTGADISASFDSLGAPIVQSIAISDSDTGGLVSISVAQAQSDTAALGKLYLANASTPATVTVTDTATNVTASGVPSFLNGDSHVGAVHVVDSGTLVGLYFDDLNGVDNLSITLTAGNNLLGLQETQVTGPDADTTALAAISNASYSIHVLNATAHNAFTDASLSHVTFVDVHDTAAQIALYFDDLTEVAVEFGLPSLAITASDGMPVIISASQGAGDGSAQTIVVANGGTVEVSDLGASIQAYLEGIQNNIANISAVYDSDSSDITVSVVQLTSDAAALAKLYAGTTGTTQQTVTVSDTAAAIGTDFDALSGNGQVDKIVVSDGGTVILTALSAAQDATALGELYQSDGTTQATVQVADTAAQVTTYLDGLQGNLGHIASIYVTDGATDNVVVGVAQLTAYAGALAEMFAGSSGSTAQTLTVSDIASQIGGSEFDALNGNSQVTKIIVADSASHTPTIGARSATVDNTALRELYQNDGTTPERVIVADTAANVTTYVARLEANVGYPGAPIARVDVSDSANIIIGQFGGGVAQLASDATILAKTYHGSSNTLQSATVTDTAAALGGAFDTLNNDAQVTRLIVSDSGSGGIVTILAENAASDATALGELYQADGSTPAQVAVSDTAANVSEHLSGIEGNIGHISAIYATDGASNNVGVTVGELTSDASALAILYSGTTGATQQKLTVSDVAANIGGAELDALSGNGQVTKIIVTNAPAHEVTIGADQAGADGTALGELFNSDGTTAALVTVSDTGANIASDFAALNGNSHVNKIIVASGTVTIGAQDAALDTTALGELYQADGTTPAQVMVSDTASSITTYLDTLEGNIGSISAIYATDGTTHDVQVSVAQLTSDATALGLLYSGTTGTTAQTLAVSDTAGAIAGDASAINASSRIDHVHVADSVANVAGNLDALNGVKDLSIYLTGTGIPLTVTEAQLHGTGADTTALDAIANDPYLIAVTGVAAADAASIAGYVSALTSHAILTTFSVTDTAANVSNAIGALAGLAHLTAVTLTDSSTGTVTVSEAALNSVNDVAALDLITNSSFNLAVTGVLAADASSVAGFVTANAPNAHLTSIAVSDTAAHLSASGVFNSLNGLAHLTAISVSNGPANQVTLDVADALADTTAEGLLKNANNSNAFITVQDTAAHIGAVTFNNGAQYTYTALNANPHIDSVRVVDLAQNVVNVAYELENTNNLSITLTDSGTPDIELNAIYYDNGFLLNAITNASFTSTIDGAAASEVSALAANAKVTHVSVIDSADDISQNFDVLNNSKVGGIDILSGNVTISVAQLFADTHAEDGLFNNGGGRAYFFVSDTAQNVANAASSINGYSNPFYVGLGGVTVSDSAANVALYLDQLNGVNDLSIQLTDGGTPTLHLYASQTTDTVALAAIQGDYNIVVADSAASISGYFDQLNALGSKLLSITVVDSASHEVTLSYAHWSADTSALSKLYNADTTPASVAVSDLASVIETNLDTLNSASQVDHIIISDNGPLALTAASAANDARAISELENANLSPVVLSVSDTATDIPTYLHALNGETNISAIVISDSEPLTLTGAEMENTAALNKLANEDGSGVEINVVDTAAGLSAHLAAIAASNDVVSIIDTDGGAITVTVAQLSDPGLAVVLSEITLPDGTTAPAIDVEDTAANIEAHLTDVDQNATPQAIIIQDSTALAMTIEQFTTDTSLLARLANADSTPYQLDIADNGANISSALDQLAAAAAGGSSHIASLTDNNDAAITLSVSQITSDAAALAILINSDGSPYTLQVQDSAADLTGALDTLEANSHVTSLVVTDSGAGHEVAVSVAQLASDSRLLAALFDANGTTAANVIVRDTAADIATAIGSLNDNTQINKIIVSDSASREVTITYAGLSDTTALGELYDADGSTHASVAVRDFSVYLTAGFDSLNADTQVDKIIISDSGVDNEPRINVSQLGTDTRALGELYKADGTTGYVTVYDDSYNLSPAFDTLNGNNRVNDLVVADSFVGNEVQISVVQLGTDTTALGELHDGNGNAAHVAIYDTVGSVQTALDTLNGNTQVNKIELSDLSGTNEVTASVAQLTSDATALSELYDATGANPAHIFVTDNAGNISSDIDNLSSDTQVNKISVTSGRVNVTVAQLTSDAHALSELYSGANPAHVSVSDVAANIGGLNGAELDALELDTQVDKILVTDSATNEVVASVSQLTSDADVLAELYDANGSTPANVTVSDTSAAISSAIDALNADTQVNKIIASDDPAGGPEVTILVSQLSDTRALGELYKANGTTPADIRISDTAAHISSAFDTLSSDAQINGIIINDAGTVVISAAQAHNDTTALGELYQGNLTTPAHVTVSDTATALSAAGVLDALNGNSHVNAIVINDNDALTLTAVQVGTDTTALGEISNANTAMGVVINVVDTGDDISQNLDALSNNPDVQTITVSDNAPVTVSVAQYSGDTNALDILQNADSSPLTLFVKDTAANISQHLTDISTSDVSAIIVSDNAPIALGSVAALTSDAGQLAILSNASTFVAGHPEDNTYTLAISDNATNISNGLNALQGVYAAGHLASLTDTTDGNIVLSVAQISSDAGALSVLTNSDGSSYTLNVQDNAADVVAALSSLNGNSHIATITLTDTIASLSITENQLDNYATALGEIGTVPLFVTVTNVLAADAGNIGTELTAANAMATLEAISVSDTAGAIATAFDTLNGVMGVDDIVVTDSLSHEVTLSVASALADITAEGMLHQLDASTPANVAVSDTAANVAGHAPGLNGNSHIDHVNVSDTGSNVASQLSGLAGVNHLAITLSGATPSISVTESQLTTYAAVLGEITNSTFNIAVTNVAAADAGSIAGEVFSANPHAVLSSLSVTDTAGNIGSVFGALDGVAHLASIIVQDSASNEVTLSVASAITDTAAEGVLYKADGTTPASVAVADTAADVAGDAAALNADSHIDHVNVSDSAANIASHFAALNGVSHLALTITGGGTLTLTESQLADTTALGDITNGTFNVAVTNVLAADAASIAGELTSANPHAVLTSITVDDTAQHIAANLDALNTTNHLASIVISNSQALAMAAEAAVNDSTALGLLSNADSSSVVLTVSDTAANIVSYLGQLNGLATISSIVISDNNPLVLTTAQLTGDTAALGKTVNANSSPIVINILDTAAHISGALDALEANVNIGTITISNNASVSLSTAQLTSDADALQLLVNANAALALSLTIKDSAANITANLGNIAANSDVTSIIISDNNPITLTATQVLADATSVGELHNQNGSGVQVSVRDNGSHIQAALDALQSTGVVTSIVDTNNTVITLTATQVQSDAAVIAEITNRNGSTPTFLVADTGANIASNLDAIQANSHITSVTVTDNGPVQVTVGQLTSDASAIGKLVNQNGSAYALTVADTAANVVGAASTISGNSHIAGVKVSDQAANVGSNIDALNAITKLASVTITDNGTMTISESQLNGDTRVMGNIIGSYHLAITAALAADAATLAANSHVTSITVTDTSTDIAAVLAALNSNTKLTSITVSNNGPVKLNVAQITAYSHALGELHDANASPYALAVKDSAAKIAAGLNGLNGNSHVASITVTDNAALQLTAAQLAADTTALSHTKNASGSAYSASIVDSGASIGANIDALTANGHIATITATGTITITNSQFHNDTSALNLIQGAHTLDVTGANGTVQGVTFTSFIENLTGTTLNSIAYYDSGNHTLENVAYSYNGVVDGQSGMNTAAYTQVTGNPYTEKDVVTNSGGTTELTSVHNTDGSLAVTDTLGGWTFPSTSSQASTYTLSGTENDTFDFGNHFGTEVIKGYTPGHDTFDLSAAAFGNNIATIEADAAQHGSSVYITIDANDVIILGSTSLAQGHTNSINWGDVHFI